MPPLSEKSLFDLTSQFFECAAEADAEGWQASYEALSVAISGSAGTIHFRHKTPDRFESIADTNEPGFVDRFNSMYWSLLPFRESLRKLKAGGHFLRTRDCPDDVYLRSEIYQDHFKRLGIYEVLHHCLFDDARFAAGITFTKDRGEGSFTEVQQLFLADLLPNLARAARLHLRVGEARVANRILIDGWHLIEDGVFLVSETGKVVFTNAAADNFLLENGEICIDRRGRLVARCGNQNHLLQARIRSVFESSPGVRSVLGGSHPLWIASRPAAVKISVTPFKESGGQHLHRERYAMVYVDLSSGAVALCESDLIEAFSLTRAEARLALLISEGKDLADIGDHLGITQHTVRTHLKRVFGKTGTNRQSSLVKLVLTGPVAKLTNRISSIISAISLIWVTT